MPSDAQYKPSFSPKWIYTATLTPTAFLDGETMVSTTVSSTFKLARVGDFFHIFMPSLENTCFTLPGVVTSKGVLTMKMGKTNITALAPASQKIIVVAY